MMPYFSHTIESNETLTTPCTSYIHPIVKYGKRSFDLIFSLFALILLAPVFVAVAIAIKVDSKGPIFYLQTRLGQDKLFTIIKFRSMGTDAEKEGKALLATKSDPRITAVGRFLRKTRLDEIPQFINVVHGEMSLIGPRPERPELTCEIEKKIPFFTERTYHVLPGITGLAQINQSYLASVNDIGQKLAFDHAYSLAITEPANWLKMDFAILVKTVFTVIKCNG